MCACRLLAFLTPFVLAVAPAPAPANVGFGVSLDSGLCCLDGGHGRATLNFNTELSLMTHDVDLHCMSSGLYSAIRIHAPVLPGQSPVAAPVVLDLGGYTASFVDCQSTVCRPALLCDRRGRAWGTTAVPPTVSGHILNGVAWMSVRSILYTGGEVWGPIRADATTGRAITWGRVKIIYR